MHLIFQLHRKGKGTLAALITLFMTLLVWLPPTPAWAAVTLTKDGLANASKADCVIDIDSLQDFTFTTTNDNFQVKTAAGTYREKNNSTEHTIYGVYFWNTPSAGERSIPGSFELVWKKALLDSSGGRHDLHAKFSNIRIKWSRNPNVGEVSQQLLAISSTSIRIMAEPGGLIRWDSAAGAYKSVYDAWETSTVNAMGVSCDVTFWNGGSSSLKYNLFARDIDQPDRFTGNTLSECSFGGAWAESFTPGSSFSQFHTSQGTWLTTDGSRISGTRVDDDEEQNRSAFVSLGTMAGNGSPLKFTWKGSMCSTRILQDWSYTLRTRVINGVGGTIYTKTAGEALIKSSTKDTWNSTGTVPKNSYLVTATPAEGYYLSGMWLDGVRVSDEEIIAGRVSVANVGANHTVSVQFRKNAPQTGTVSIAKSSSEPSITTGNACYSLEGALYGVYADEACASSVGSLVTGADGHSQELEVAAGTYYVREELAPQGYALDSTVHPVSVSAGQTATLELQEVPEGLPIDLIIQKVDADTGQDQPQGGATLEGAEFTVRFYAGNYVTDTLPAEPTHTWVLRTDAHGRASLATSSVVSGDDLYTLGGETVIPLGTVSIVETKAPQGYLLTQEEPIVRSISIDEELNPTGISAPTTQSPTASDEVMRGGLMVKKVDEAGDVPLQGASFALRNDSDSPVMVNGESFPTGATCLVIETQADGIARTGARVLPYGTYTLVEQRAPDGFWTDSTWSETVTISEDGMVVDLTDHPVRNRRITTDVTIRATKTFDGSSQGLSLEAGMFTFVLFDEAGEPLQSKTNDDEGTVTFDALSFDYGDLDSEHIYTIRETAGTDELISYDTHVETLRISLATDEDGALVATVETDEDGLAFHNSTVPEVDLPLTGGGGTGDTGLSAAIVLTASLIATARRRHGSIRL